MKTPALGVSPHLLSSGCPDCFWRHQSDFVGGSLRIQVEKSITTECPSPALALGHLLHCRGGLWRSVLASWGEGTPFCETQVSWGAVMCRATSVIHWNLSQEGARKAPCCWCLGFSPSSRHLPTFRGHYTVAKQEMSPCTTIFWQWPTGNTHPSSHFPPGKTQRSQQHRAESIFPRSPGISPCLLHPPAAVTYL